MPPNGNGAEPPKAQSPVRIKHDGDFYARLLSRESSLANPSFRYYGAGPGSVPFVWESQPGTPKDSSRIGAAAVPAITPPPSYHLRRHGKAVPVPHQRPSTSSKSKAKNNTNYSYNYKKHHHCYKFKWIKIGFIAAVFRKLAAVKSRQPSSSVQATSSTRWLFSGPTGVEGGDLQGHYERAQGVLCFGVRPSPWVAQLCGRRDRGWGMDGWM